MKRSYQINGLDFSLNEIVWRYENDEVTHKGLMLQDNTPPCVYILMPQCKVLPPSAEEAFALLQKESGEQIFERDALGNYIILARKRQR